MRCCFLFLLIFNTQCCRVGLGPIRLIVALLFYVIGFLDVLNDDVEPRLLNCRDVLQCFFLFFIFQYLLYVYNVVCGV